MATVAASIPEQILGHATRLFAERGFDGVSVQEIADAVGISKPSLLYHFPSKDDLRRRVLENLMAHWNDVLPHLLRAATSGEGQFDAVALETVRFFAADADRARLLMREMLDRPDDMNDLASTHVKPWVTVVCDYIRKGQAQGRVHADVDPEAYVHCVINLVLATLSTNHSLGAVAPAAEDSIARATREVLRVAKSSLFLSTKEK